MRDEVGVGDIPSAGFHERGVLMHAGGGVHSENIISSPEIASGGRKGGGIEERITS